MSRAAATIADEDLPAGLGPEPPTKLEASRQESSGASVWLALAALVLLLGMLFGASLWLYAAYAALGMFAVNRFMGRLWGDSVAATRTTGTLDVRVGAVVPIEIEVTNHGKLPVVWLLVEDLLPRAALLYDPPALEVEGTRIQVMLLAPGKSRFVRYRLRCHRRGYFQIGPTVLETGDLMGLSRRYRVGAQPQFLMVMPRVLSLSGYDVRSPRPMGEIKIRERTMEDPSRLQGIRQWLPGDSLRQVHWSATARTGVLHSKIYEPTSVAGATIVLDFHRQTNPERHEPMRSDLAVTAAASIAGALYEMNQPVGLVSNGRDAADRVRVEGWAGDFRLRSFGSRDAARQQASMRASSDRLRPVVVSTGRGPLVYHEIQRSLARLERTDGMPLATLLIETEPQLARDASLLVILQTYDAATAAALIGLRRRGWMVTVVINDLDVTEFAKLAGTLVAADIQVLHLRDETALAQVCREVTLRG